MSDRLEEIKEQHRLSELDEARPLDEFQIDWLISEVERLRAENEQLKDERDESTKLYDRYVDRFTNAVGDRNKLRNEIKELAQSFREGKIGEITDSFLVDEILAIVGDKDD